MGPGRLPLDCRPIAASAAGGLPAEHAAASCVCLRCRTKLLSTRSATQHLRPCPYVRPYRAHAPRTDPRAAATLYGAALAAAPLALGDSHGRPQHCATMQRPHRGQAARPATEEDVPYN